MAGKLPRAQTEKIVLIAKALGSAPRLDMLRAMRDPGSLAAAAGEISDDGVCLTLLARIAGVTDPTALRHLRVLVDAGLCTVRRGARYTYYRRDERAIAAIADTVTRHL